MEPEILALISFGALLIGIMMGFPVAFVLLGLALIFGFIGWGPGVFDLMVARTYWIMSNDVLVAVPLFIFMGYILERSGIWDGLFGTLQVLLGPVRGSLALATTIVCTLFAAATGIIGSEITLMGLLALPAMLKRNYNVRLATGTILAAGTLGILIPPSIMLILYGLTAGLSIARLFTAAIFPGLLLSSLYFTYIAIICYFRPHLGPPLPPELRRMPIGTLFIKLLTSLIAPALLIFCVLGSIILGIAAPTEAAAVGGTASVMLALIYRKLSLKDLKDAVYLTLRTTSMVLSVTVGASCFTGTFMRLGGGLLIEDFLLGLEVSPLTLLIIILIGVFLMGMFIDWIAIIFIFVPILVSVVEALGFDPIWVSLLICINLQTSFLTPPFAIAIFYLKGVAPTVPLMEIYKGLPPFIALQLLGLAICIKFPQIILWLPSVIYK